MDSSLHSFLCWLIVVAIFGFPCSMVWLEFKKQQRMGQELAKEKAELAKEKAELAKEAAKKWNAIVPKGTSLRDSILLMAESAPISTWQWSDDQWDSSVGYWLLTVGNAVLKLSHRCDSVWLECSRQGGTFMTIGIGRPTDTQDIHSNRIQALWYRLPPRLTKREKLDEYFKTWHKLCEEERQQDILNALRGQ